MEWTGECDDGGYLPYNVSAYPWDELNTTGKSLALHAKYGERIAENVYTSAMEMSALVAHVIMFFVVNFFAWKLHKKLQKVKGKGIALRNAAYGYCICGAAVITYDATRSPISFGLGGATTDFFCAAYQGFDHVVNSVEKGFLLYFVFQKFLVITRDPMKGRNFMGGKPFTTIFCHLIVGWSVLQPILYFQHGANTASLWPTMYILIKNPTQQRCSYDLCVDNITRSMLTPENVEGYIKKGHIRPIVNYACERVDYYNSDDAIFGVFAVAFSAYLLTYVYLFIRMLLSLKSMSAMSRKVSGKKGTGKDKMQMLMIRELRLTIKMVANAFFLIWLAPIVLRFWLRGWIGIIHCIQITFNMILIAQSFGVRAELVSKQKGSKVNPASSAASSVSSSASSSIAGSTVNSVASSNASSHAFTAGAGVSSSAGVSNGSTTVDSSVHVLSSAPGTSVPETSAAQS